MWGKRLAAFRYTNAISSSLRRRWPLDGSSLNLFAHRQDSVRRVTPRRREMTRRLAEHFDRSVVALRVQTTLDCSALIGGIDFVVA